MRGVLPGSVAPQSEDDAIPDSACRFKNARTVDVLNSDQRGESRCECEALAKLVQLLAGGRWRSVESATLLGLEESRQGHYTYQGIDWVYERCYNP